MGSVGRGKGGGGVGWGNPALNKAPWQHHQLTPVKIQIFECQKVTDTVWQSNQLNVTDIQNAQSSKLAESIWQHYLAVPRRLSVLLLRRLVNRPNRRWSIHNWCHRGVARRAMPQAWHPILELLEN